MRRAQWEGGPDVPPEILENSNGFGENYRQLVAPSWSEAAEAAAFVLAQVSPMADGSVHDCSGITGGDFAKFIASVPCRVIAPEKSTGRLVVRVLYLLCEAP